MSGYKRTGCFLLVLILVFMTFANPLATQARAEPITLAVGTAATLITLLAMIGITFATVDLAKQAAQSFVNANPDIWDDINRIQVGGGGNGDPGGNRPGFFFDVANTAGAITILNRLKSFFGDGVGGEGCVYVPDETSGAFDGIQFVNQMQFLSASEAFAKASYSYRFFTVDSPLVVNVGSKVYKFCCMQGDTPTTIMLVCSEDGGSYQLIRALDFGSKSLYMASDIDRKILNVIDFRFGFRFNSSNPRYSLLVPFVAYKFIDENGRTRTEYSAPQSCSVSVIVNSSGVTYPKKPINYNNNSKYPLGNIISALPDAVNKQGTIVVDTTDTVNDLNNNPDTSPKVTQDTVLIDTGLKDILEQIKQGQEEDDFDAPKLPGGELLEKFPFCVPFDLFRIVQALNATPKAPQFTIPVKLAVIDYYEEFTFDLSEYEILASRVRFITTLFYITALILLSRKLIKG